MKSMTGFGESHRKLNSRNIRVVIRGVNGRYLDFKMHLPVELQDQEREVRDLLSKSISRGTVSLHVSLQQEGLNQNVHSIDVKKAKLFVLKTKQLAKKIGVEHDLTLSKVADLLSEDKFEAQWSSQDKKDFLKTVEEALKEFDKERSREGSALKKVLHLKVKKLNELRNSILELREEANSQLKDRIQKRIQELKLESFTEERMKEEVAWLLDKADINEELERLKAHLNHFDELTESKEPAGKKLDFYTQELLREVNTIGSKSQVSDLTHAVVEAKNLIEQLKEQVQNIE